MERNGYLPGWEFESRKLAKAKIKSFNIRDLGIRVIAISFEVVMGFKEAVYRWAIEPHKDVSTAYGRG